MDVVVSSILRRFLTVSPVRSLPEGVLAANVALVWSASHNFIVDIYRERLDWATANGNGAVV